MTETPENEDTPRDEYSAEETPTAEVGREPLRDRLVRSAAARLGNALNAVLGSIDDGSPS